MALDDLRQWVSEGRLSPEAVARSDASADWRPVAEVTGLMPPGQGAPGFGYQQFAQTVGLVPDASRAHHRMQAKWVGIGSGVGLVAGAIAGLTRGSSTDLLIWSLAGLGAGLLIGAQRHRHLCCWTEGAVGEAADASAAVPLAAANSSGPARRPGNGMSMPPAPPGNCRGSSTNVYTPPGGAPGALGVAT